jgi:membrane protein
MAAWIELARATWDGYQRHNGPWLAAALAYFAAFAIAPLIIVVVAISGLFLHAHRQVLDTVYAAMPPGGGSAVRAIVAATFAQRRHGEIAQIAGWIVFVFAAIGLFGSLQSALNAAWDLEQRKRSPWRAIADRALTFCMMLVAAFLLLISVVANAVLNALSAPKAGDFALSLVVVWALFTLLFEYLPDTRVAWRDACTGGALTALLFVVGQSVLGWYLGRAAITSAYGAFGSLVVFLLWANYSAQIVLLGAEFTHAYAQRRSLHP